MGVFRVFLFQGFLYGHPGSLWYLASCANPYFCSHGVCGQFVFYFAPPSLMPASFAVGPCYLSLLFEGGCDLLLAPCGWVRRIKLSVVERVGISSAFSLSFRPCQFMTVGCVVAGSLQYVVVCCSVLWCVAICCSLFQCAVVCCNAL